MKRVRWKEEWKGKDFFVIIKRMMNWKDLKYFEQQRTWTPSKCPKDPLKKNLWNFYENFTRKNFKKIDKKFFLEMNEIFYKKKSFKKKYLKNQENSNQNMIFFSREVKQCQASFLERVFPSKRKLSYSIIWLKIYLYIFLFLFFSRLNYTKKTNN